MQHHFPSVLERLRRGHSFLQVVVLVLLVQALLPLGAALAADVQGDTDFNPFVCRVLNDVDNDTSDTDVLDCPVCLAMHAGKSLLSVAPSAQPNNPAQVVTHKPLAVPPLAVTYRANAKQVRAPPYPC